MINSRKQNGSALVVVVIVLIIALLGALGFIYWQNVLVKNQDTAENTTTSQAPGDDDAEATGVISGSLTYPSDHVPSNIEVHAVNLETNQEYVTKEHIVTEQRTSYKVTVPVGRYHVYGMKGDNADWKAYHNQFIVCGMKVECTDTSKIEVTVEADKEVSDITVGDWWTVEE